MSKIGGTAIVLVILNVSIAFMKEFSSNRGRVYIVMLFLSGKAC